MNGENGKRREFEGFSLDTEEKILWRAGEIVPLPPKAVEMLIVLIKKSGEVVTKDDLLETVWGDAFVEESVLSNNVYLLRKTLTELGAGKSLIQTVPRRGYRFNGGMNGQDAELVLEHHVFEQTLVEEVTVENDSVQKTVAPAPLALPAKPRGFFGDANRIGLVSLAAILILILSGFGIWNYRKSAAKASLANITSIAVLPLKSLSKETVDENLRLRITDSLITNLGNLNKFSVRPTSSVLPFANEDANILEIGKQLAVEAIMEGRVQQENGRLRVNLQLVSVADGTQIWSGQFDGETEKLLNLQDTISAKFVSQFAASFTEQQTADAAQRPTENAAAYENYLRGRYHWNQRTSKNLLKAIEEFDRAVELDPNFALAYVGLADCYALLSVYDERPPLESYPIAKQKAQFALNLNPNLAEAHTTLAFVSYRFEWNWKLAEQEFRRAIELKPNYATAHHWFGEFLMASGRFDEAATEYRKALELDPTSLIINTDLGYGLFLARRYDDSINQLRKTINLNPNFPLAYYCLADSLSASNRKTEAVEVFIRWMTLIETDAPEVSRLQTAFGSNNYAEFEKSRLKWVEAEVRKKNFTRFDVARSYAETTDKNNALYWLENAAKERAADLIFIGTHPSFDSLRDEPRFQAILRQMNL